MPFATYTFVRTYTIIRQVRVWTSGAQKRPRNSSKILGEFRLEKQMTSPFKIERNQFDDDQELCVITQKWSKWNWNSPRILLKIPIGKAAILTSRWLHLLRLKETDSMITKNFVWSLKTMDKGWPKKAGKTVTCSAIPTQLRPFFRRVSSILGAFY